MQRDYILRIIEQFGQAIASIVQYYKAGDYGQALEQLQLTSQKYLNEDISFFIKFTPDQLVEYFKRGSYFDIENSIICADLIHELAAISKEQNCVKEAYSLKLMALALYMNAIPKDSDFQTEAYLEKVAILSSEIDKVHFSQKMHDHFLHYQAFLISKQQAAKN